MQHESQPPSLHMVLLPGFTVPTGSHLDSRKHYIRDDGLLNICHVRMMSRFEVLGMFPILLWGGHVSLPQGHYVPYDVRQIRDAGTGDSHCRCQPVGLSPETICIAPGGLRVRCPAQKGETS